MPALIFRKGLDLKHEVAGVLADSYHSDLVQRIKATDYRFEAGRLTVHLAREFGFCYGVDRAVDYAYQARKRFPDQQVFLTGEIIHNPHVNDQLRAQGIRFLSDPGEDWARLGAGDVVILPAFGVTVEEMLRLDQLGATLVDTTCGSVLNVWKNVKRYALDGFTSVIHGKHWHEETRATASQAVAAKGGHYLVVLDKTEAAVVCDYITGAAGSSAARAQFLERFKDAISPGFDPGRSPERVGCANQTTMLSTESLEIGEMFRAAMRHRFGDADLASRFRAFDTICSATQDRQDAVIRLLGETPLDLMLVVGGYNSSNTCNLARICAASVPTFHLADPEGLISPAEIRHRHVASKTEVTTTGVAAGLRAGEGGADLRRLHAGQPGRAGRAQARGLHGVNTRRTLVVSLLDLVMQTLSKSFICLALSLVVLGIPAQALAQGFKWWQDDRFQKELALTPEQITRLEGLFQTTEPTLRAQKDALERREDKLSKVIADPKSDEPAVLQASERVEAARNELSKTRTLMLFRMRRILTDEQNVKMKQIHERDKAEKDKRPRGNPPPAQDPACFQ